MKITLRGVSGAALLFGLASIQPAFAQQAAQPAQPKNQTVRTSQPAVVQDDLSGPQVAQTTPPQAGLQGDTKADKVVITGSLIATTPEDAPKPVEVYTSDNLKEQGNPSVSDFVRSLTVSAGSSIGFGQANPQVPAGTGFSSADLRGLGPNATMTMLNGHNMNPANGGYGADLNTIPTAALEAVEVLKDGASSTYGAGAVGGVLNFRTRRDINAPQLSVQKAFYKDGDGNLRIDFLDGWKGDAGNLLINYTYEHEGRMGADKRDFSSLPFRVNPSEWSLTAGNPGGFNAISANFLTATSVTGAQVSPLFEDLRGGFTSPGGAAATADCNAIGGEIANQVRPGSLQLSTLGANTGCIFSYAPYEDLVSDTTRNQAYAEFNASLSDNMEVHFSASYSKDARIQEVTPANAALNRATDGLITPITNPQCAISATTQYGCGYVIPYQVNSYSVAGAATATATVNPFIQDFMTRTGITSAQLPTTGALYTAADWRPWFAGGNPLYGDGLTHNLTTREQVLISSGLSGNFSEDGFLGRIGLGKLLNGINYDFNAQYLQYQQTFSYPDIFISRLQNALLGYGGPNCNAVDRVPTDFSSAAAFNRTIGIQSDTAPGTNGCQWLNPFASAFPTSVMNGAANPQFNSGTPVLAGNATARPLGYQNSKELADWLTGNKEVEDLYQTSTFNYTLTGELPKQISLPGGKIGWAAGTEWRMVQRQDSTFDSSRAEVTMNTQRCPFPDPTVVESNSATNAPNPNQTGQQPGSRGCITGSGAFNGSNYVLANTGETIPYYHDTQELAFFGEVQLPVTNKLNMDLSVRREDYNGGKIGATIYNVSGKYAITDNIYVRGSYGTNFRADTALDLQPGLTTQSNPAQGRFGGLIIPTYTTVASDLKPENDVTQNYGIGYKNNDIFGGRLRASVDWSQTSIQGFVTTASATTVYANVFGRNDAAGTAPNPAVGVGGSQNNRGFGPPGSTALVNSRNQLADCNATLIQYVQFDSPCVLGVTTANNIIGVTQSRLNGPGFITNGLDYVFDYSHPLFDGDIGLNVTATETLVYKAQAFIVNGALFQPASHNLGYANWTHQGAGGTNAGAGLGNSAWKANATLRWANDEHNINLRATYDSGRYDERYDPGAVQQLPLTALENGTTHWSTYGIARKNFLSFDFVYIYTPNWMKNLELQAQVLDLFDRNPPLAQFQLGYQSGIGDPRKRTFVLRAGYKF